MSPSTFFSASIARLFVLAVLVGAVSAQSDYIKEQSKNLPPYTYNMTSETQSTRTAICTQQTSYCNIAQCQSPLAKISVNFCNPSTMGWNCECSEGLPRLTDHQAPINQFDCQFRNGACKTACQNTQNVAVANTQNCLAACQNVYGATCGTGDQIMPQYKVQNENDTPKYFGDTSKGGGAFGAASRNLIPTSSLAISAAALAVLGGLSILA